MQSIKKKFWSCTGQARKNNHIANFNYHSGQEKKWNWSYAFSQYYVDTISIRIVKYGNNSLLCSWIYSRNYLCNLHIQVKIIYAKIDNDIDKWALFLFTGHWRIRLLKIFIRFRIVFHQYSFYPKRAETFGFHLWYNRVENVCGIKARLPLTILALKLFL